MNYAKHSTVKPNSKAPVQQKIDDKQILNHTGGYVFQVSDIQQLERFLILGTEGNTYYCSEKEQCMEVSKVIEIMIKQDAMIVVRSIMNIRKENRAFKQSPMLYVMALIYKHGNNTAKSALNNHFNELIWTFTQLAEFVAYVKSMRSIGRSVKTAISNWYNSKNSMQVAYQMVKYPSRKEWTHKDVFRVSHICPSDAIADLFNWYCKHEDLAEFASTDNGVNYLFYASKLKTLKDSEYDVKEALRINAKFEKGFPFEAFSTETMRSPKLWETLLPNMKGIALLRNLGRMTANGTLEPLSKNTKMICEMLTNEEYMKTNFVHPLQIIVALLQYKEGKGLKGSLQWKPISMICDALERAANNSFKYIEPTGKNFLFGVDISGSMGMGQICGTSMSPRLGSAIMALQLAKVEKNYEILGFSDKLIDLNITKTDSIKSCVEKISGHLFGATDPSLLFRYAIENKIDVDCFVVITDNEVNGGYHVSEMMKKYRMTMKKPNAKLVVIGMTVTRMSIADPKDMNMLDVVGFDTNCPKLVQEFANR